MKKFQWRLQRILDLKENEEQLKKSELNQIAQQIARANNRLTRLHLKLQDILGSLNEKDLRIRMNEHELTMRYTANNDEAIKKVQLNISELTQLQSTKMNELLELRRFKEGLSKLREKEELEFLKEQQRLEQNEMDDRSTIRYARKNMMQAETSN